MSKVAFSLPSLAAGLGGLEQLGTGWVSVTMWPLHMASWDFFKAWWSQGSQASHMTVASPRGSMLRDQCRNTQVASDLALEVPLCPLRCILLVLNETCSQPRFKGKTLEECQRFTAIFNPPHQVAHVPQRAAVNMRKDGMCESP